MEEPTQVGKKTPCLKTDSILCKRESVIGSLLSGIDGEDLKIPDTVKL